jgi:hypothetical protein
VVCFVVGADVGADAGTEVEVEGSAKSARAGGARQSAMPSPAVKGFKSGDRKEEMKFMLKRKGSVMLK